MNSGQTVGRGFGQDVSAEGHAHRPNLQTLLFYTAYLRVLQKFSVIETIQALTPDPSHKTYFKAQQKYAGGGGKL